MNPDELMTRAGDQLSVRRVFGEPIERDGVTVIPVAVAVRRRWRHRAGRPGRRWRLRRDRAQHRRVCRQRWAGPLHPRHRRRRAVGARPAPDPHAGPRRPPSPPACPRATDRVMPWSTCTGCCSAQAGMWCSARHEVRHWGDSVLPDLDEAVDSPHPPDANSNSVLSWLLACGGHDMEGLEAGARPGGARARDRGLDPLWRASTRPARVPSGRIGRLTRSTQPRKGRPAPRQHRPAAGTAGALHAGKEA